MKRFLRHFLTASFLAAQLAVTNGIAKAELPTLPSSPSSPTPPPSKSILPVIPSSPAASPNALAKSPTKKPDAGSSSSPTNSPSKSKPSKVAKVMISAVSLNNACYVQLAKLTQVTRKKLNAQQTRTCKNLVTLITKGKAKIVAKGQRWIKRISFSAQGKPVFAFNTKQIDRDLNYTLAGNPNPPSSSPQSSSSSSQSSSTPVTPPTKTPTPPQGISVKWLVYDTDFSGYVKDFSASSPIQSYEILCFKPSGSITSAKFKIPGLDVVTDSGSIICAGGKDGDNLVSPGLDDGSYAMSVELFNSKNASLGTIQVPFSVSTVFDQG